MWLCAVILCGLGVMGILSLEAGMQKFEDLGCLGVAPDAASVGCVLPLVSIEVCSLSSPSEGGGVFCFCACIQFVSVSPCAVSPSLVGFTNLNVYD